MLFNSKQVKEIVNVLWPDWNKREASIQPVEQVTISHMYWDSGYCQYYGVVDLATMTGQILPLDNPLRHITNHTQDMQPGKVVLMRTYSGMREYMTIYCHPSNMPVNIAGPTEQLTQEELAVLYYTRSRKPCYAGISNYRYYAYCSDGGKMSDQQWANAKEALIGKKLLTKAGALSTLGKNRASNLDHSYKTKMIEER